MIRRIRGEIAEMGPEHVLLEVGSIYYEVFLAPATAERLMERPIGSEIELHTFHYLQDDQARSVPILMGFETQLQREFFERLIDAPRFGPRGALRSMTIPLTTYAKAIEIASQVRTGTYGVNMYAFDPGAPFGGYKNSGIGRECGPEGISGYCESKSVLLPFGYTPEI